MNSSNTKQTHTADGGPAFPSPACGDWSPEYGMSLRDWFAGQALSGFMANTRRPTTIAEDDADWCFQIADAMLAARASSRAS